MRRQRCSTCGRVLAWKWSTSCSKSTDVQALLKANDRLELDAAALKNELAHAGDSTRLEVEGLHAELRPTLQPWVDAMDVPAGRHSVCRSPQQHTPLECTAKQLRLELAHIRHAPQSMIGGTCMCYTSLCPSSHTTRASLDGSLDSISSVRDPDDDQHSCMPWLQTPSQGCQAPRPSSQPRLGQAPPDLPWLTADLRCTASREPTPVTPCL